MLRLVKAVRSAAQTSPVIVPTISELLWRLKSLENVSFEKSLDINDEFRRRIPLMSVSELLECLNTLSRVPRDRSLGLVGDVFRHLDHLSLSDAFEFIKICGQLRVYDSAVFERLESNLVISSIEELRILLVSLNRLKISNFFRSEISRFVKSNSVAILHSDLRKTIFPLMRYSDDEEIVNICVASFHEKVEAIRKDSLGKSRSVLTSSDLYSLVTILAEFVTRHEEARLSTSLCDDVKYCCKTILSYEVRSWDFDRLIKLFFGMSKLKVFDDFFVRRRLVPAISQAWKDKVDKSDRDKELLRVMISQLPFRNTMIEELEVDIS